MNEEILDSFVENVGNIGEEKENAAGLELYQDILNVALNREDNEIGKSWYQKSF